MIRNFIGTLMLCFLLQGLQAQVFQLFSPGTQWIMETQKIQKKNLVFKAYSKDKVELNTMVWTFEPGGLISYDYQSSQDIYACAGVDFLDMDVTECRWEYDPQSQFLTLLIKGGYASIDDFVFKRKYKVEVYDDDDENYGYHLKLETEYFYNDLNQK